MKTFLIALLLWPGMLLAQNTSDHEKAIGQVCDQMLSAISVEQGEEMDWTLIESLFLPSARLSTVVPNADSILISSVDIPTFKKAAPQTRVGFKEEMVKRKIHVFGNAAVVLESYKAEVLSSGQKMRGVNMYQLLYNGKRWKIVSIIWDELRSEDEQIPKGLFR